ncbi:S8 family serine peptidase, partial [Deinococcus sp.]|uniref:S8 family serine peptidase n=1 Tax=Deinococcus sp. TaxID=47478 RepID=UPI0038D3CED7
MNKNAILLTTLALVLASCGSSGTPTANVPSAPAANTPTADTGAALTLTLAARLGLTPGQTLNLPDVSTLTRGSGDTSAPDVIVRYTELSDVQALARHLSAQVSGVIPELRAALLTLPSTLSGRKVALSVGAGGGTLSASENGHSAQLAPVSGPGGTVAPL